MKTVPEVVKPLINEHGDVHWKVGIVMSLQAGHKITVQFVGAAGGAGTPGCGYVDQYTPQVGHIVHAITSETRGVLVLGSTGTGSPVLLGAETAPMALMAEESAPAPTPDAVSDVARCGTFVGQADGRLQFVPSRVIQGPGYLGVWGFTNLSTVIQNAQNSGLIISAEIEVTLIHGGPGISLVLVEDNGGNPATTWPVHRGGRLELGIPTRVAMPLGWLDVLAGGLATIGVSDTSMADLAAYDLTASVYLTVQTV